VQLCAALTPKPRRARFRALRLRTAPEIDSASLRSYLANYETNVFLLAYKGQILHRHRGAAVANALTLATAQPKQVDWLDPADILTPEQLAKRLQVSKSWVFEQTRNRAKVRNKHPLPCIRLGKYIRFSWSEVCQWMRENNS
jgi:predicted DNA-binding transcriptional regulator AlpA